MLPLWELKIFSPKGTFESMIFLFPTWDTLVPCMEGSPYRKLTGRIPRKTWISVLHFFAAKKMISDLDECTSIYQRVLFEPQGWCFFSGPQKSFMNNTPKGRSRGNKSPKKKLGVAESLCRPRFTHKGAGGDFNDFFEFLKRSLEDPFSNALRILGPPNRRVWRCL